MRVEATGLERFTQALAVLEAGVVAGAMPGAVATLLSSDDVRAELVVGRAALEPRPRPQHHDTIFDLASLTKLITTTATLALLERGLVCLDDPVARFLPGMSVDGKDALCLRHLLTHTAGLRAWYPLYVEAGSATEAVECIARLPLASGPGERVEYSDLGFVLLGAALEAVAGMPLERVLRELVLDPLGMAHTRFNPPASLHSRIAPTERDNSYEAAMVRQMGLSFDGWERGLACGRVHDGNAAYSLGGVSGHAGLFAPARDLARLARMWLREGEGLLQPRTVQLATRSWTDALGERRGLGWAIYNARPVGPSLGQPRSGGDLLGDRAFGHTGFTGTSLWIDPELDLAVILLANRVHPNATPDLFGRVRALFHNAVVCGVGWNEPTAEARSC